MPLTLIRSEQLETTLTSKTMDTMTISGGAATLSTNLLVDFGQEFRFFEDTVNGADYVALTPPTSVALSFTLTLPNADGGAGDVLTTNGAGILSFSPAATPHTHVGTETPTGAIDGLNASYTLANTPSPSTSLELFLNGVLQNPAGNDYTLVGNTITYTSAPQIGDVHLAYYIF